jgi:hypothetical protein
MRAPRFTFLCRRRRTGGQADFWKSFASHARPACLKAWVLASFRRTGKPVKVDSATFAKAVEYFGQRGTMDLVAVMNTYAVSGFYAIAVDEHPPAGRPALEGSSNRGTPQRGVVRSTGGVSFRSLCCLAGSRSIGYRTWRKTDGRNFSADFGRFDVKTQIRRMTAAAAIAGLRRIDSPQMHHSIAAQRRFQCRPRLWFFCCAVVGLALSSAVWAQQPERLLTETIQRPKPVWTPSSDAPAGVLTHQLEGQRHDRFIELAQKGDIDLVFFGTTETEMWSWPDRGRSVWDRAFGPLKAANFGSQGTQPNSLLWRMRNGELDGYQAKLVVFQTWGPGVTPISGDGRADTGAIYAPIIAEIRARQPQARILLFPPLPRGQVDQNTWRQMAVANAVAFSRLADNETIFYVNIGERFFLPDGSHNQAMWRYPPVSGPVSVGTQTAAYEVWAEELQPWLDRFVR